MKLLMFKPHSANQAVAQLKDQLSSEKRKLSFLFGAGTSMSVGLPGVIDLTNSIETAIDPKFKDVYLKFTHDVASNNIEVILNKLRTIRDLIGDSDATEYHGIKGKSFAQEFDRNICIAIAGLVSNGLAKTKEPQLDFANWLFKYQTNRVSPVELFTTNYDLLFEEAFEDRNLPYFDGFVGSINPFIVPECIEADNNKMHSHAYAPLSWLRLWKIHGSINWYLYKDASSKNRITRCSTRTNNPGDEVMIFPSRQKYDESRRLPFLLFQDRFRRFLSQGEVLLIINGYSFNDDHINETIFQSLRANKRLAVTALMFGDFSGGVRIINDSILNYGLEHPNLSILGPDRACIGGNIGSWSYDGPYKTDNIFWNDKEKTFELGNFSIFCKYLKQHFHIN